MQCTRRYWLRWVGVAALLLGMGPVSTPGLAQDHGPIRIGFSVAQTGPLSAAGKSGLLALQIWRDDVNARGGLLGRQVELVVYSSAASPTKISISSGKAASR